MEVFEAISARRSVRSYEARALPDEIVVKLLESARLAPSAMNFQPWRFIVVRSQEKRDVIARGGMFARFASQAPLAIVACGDSRSRFHIHDTCIALEHIVLAATSLGLGTCWIGSFDEAELRRELSIPKRFRVVAILTVGYPAEGRDLGRAVLHLFRSTKRLDEIAFSEEFGRPLGA
jgi:nitroreductase